MAKYLPNPVLKSVMFSNLKDQEHQLELKYNFLSRMESTNGHSTMILPYRQLMVRTLQLVTQKNICFQQPETHPKRYSYKGNGSNTKTRIQKMKLNQFVPKVESINLRYANKWNSKIKLHRHKLKVLMTQLFLKNKHLKKVKIIQFQKRIKLLMNKFATLNTTKIYKPSTTKKSLMQRHLS